MTSVLSPLTHTLHSTISSLLLPRMLLIFTLPTSSSFLSIRSSRSHGFAGSLITCETTRKSSEMITKPRKMMAHTWGSMSTTTADQLFHYRTEMHLFLLVLMKYLHLEIQTTMENSCCCPVLKHRFDRQQCARMPQSIENCGWGALLPCI